MSDSKEYFTKHLENGSIHVSEEVVLAVAAAAVMEVDGVIAMNANFGSELQERLGKKNPFKGIRLSMQEDAVVIDCSVVVLYGCSLQELGANVQETVTQAVESMTGLKVAAVNVNIAGISMTKRS